MGLTIPGLGKLGLMDIIGIGGDVASRMSAARAANRSAQADYNLDYDEQERRRVETLQQQALIDVRQREYADKANAFAQKQRYAANWMRAPNAFTPRPPELGFSGSPGNYGPEMMPNRQATADDLERQAMIRILKPVTAGTGDDTLPELPELDELSRTDLEPGALDKFLDYAGLAGGAVSLYNKNQRARTPRPELSVGNKVPNYLLEGQFKLPPAPTSTTRGVPGPVVGDYRPTSFFDNPESIFNRRDTPVPYGPQWMPQLPIPPQDPRYRPQSPSGGLGGVRMLPTY